MSDKTWTDQPDETEEAVLLWSGARVRDLVLEIRSRPGVGGGVYYVTFGSLFGSQTIKCKDENAMWALLRETDRASKVRRLPEGTELLANADEEKQ